MLIGGETKERHVLPGHLSFLFLVVAGVHGNVALGLVHEIKEAPHCGSKGQ